jgi:hypothetical protein
VLVEPELATYTAHLSPLLEDATYKHAVLLEDALDPQHGLLSQYGAGGDANTRNTPPKHNSSLLLTVNLSGPHLRTANYAGAPSRKFFDDLYLSLWGIRSNVHRYGLLRVLAWVPDDEKDAYIPRTVSVRRKQAVMLEASSQVREVAGASTNHKSTFFRKWPRIDAEDFARVQAKEKEAGLKKLPDSRRDQTPPPDLLSIEPTVARLRSATGFSSDAGWVSKFQQLDEHLRTHDPAWYKTYAAAGKFHRQHLKTPAQKAWRVLLKRAQSAHRTHTKAVELVERQRELEREWKNCIKGGALTSSEDERFRRLADTLQTQIKQLNRTDRAFAEKAIDDCRAMDLRPPVTAWNQRDTNPVLVQDTDFGPKGRGRHMALLDVLPRPEFVSAVQTHDAMVVFGFVTKILSLNAAKSVREALVVLVHEEGLEDFVAKIPDIHDLTKGGWYDLSALRVRSLPADLLVQIAQAYESWPFRRSTESILMAGPDPQAAYSLGEDD